MSQSGRLGAVDADDIVADFQRVAPLSDSTGFEVSNTRRCVLINSSCDDQSKVAATFTAAQLDDG
jgi:hypothetical protein